MTLMQEYCRGVNREGRDMNKLKRATVFLRRLAVTFWDYASWDHRIALTSLVRGHKDDYAVPPWLREQNPLTDTKSPQEDAAPKIANNPRSAQWKRSESPKRFRVNDNNRSSKD